MGGRLSAEFGAGSLARPGGERQGGISRALALVLVVGALTIGAVGGGLGVAWLRGDPATVTPSESHPGTQGLPAFDLPAMIAEVEQSVVALKVVTRVELGLQSYTTLTSGTGTVLTADGMIATSAHVVADAVSITVRLPDGQSVAGRVVGSNDGKDLAVIAVDRKDLVPIKRGTSTNLRVGETVVALGYALGMEGGPTVTMGIVSALGRQIATAREVDLFDLIQTDAAINEGESGGPLVDHDGRLVGITTACGIGAENIGFAITVDAAIPILEGMMGRSLD